MSEQHHWLAAVPRQTYLDERLYAHDEVELPPGADEQPAPGDPVALVALGDNPMLFGLGRALPDKGRVRYTHRALDEPIELAGEVPLDPSEGAGVRRITSDEYSRLAALVSDQHRVTGPGTRRAEWMVMAAIPIEAATAGEAVREFWTYVDKLGPRELPAFVWPRGDEYAMQAFVLGEPANQDPEEDD
ncbi:MAG TPA: hypothetical protein VK028_03260 [Micromonosporaceae bacterium]|nr:hypothetical protein [Micromonosporaceae bacterium]